MKNVKSALDQTKIIRNVFKIPVMVKIFLLKPAIVPNAMIIKLHCKTRILRNVPNVISHKFSLVQ